MATVTAASTKGRETKITLTLPAPEARFQSAGLARVWLSQSDGRLFGQSRRNVAIYGAGSAGIQLAHALSHSRELKPVAFLDDDPRLQRNRLGELEVFSPQRLAELVNQFGIAYLVRY